MSSLKPGDKCPLFKDGVVPGEQEQKQSTYLQGENIPLEEPNKIKQLTEWWKDLKVKPHVAIRDLNQGEGARRPALEVGVRFSF